MVDNTGGLSQR